jgi:hypothetical protein
MSQEINPFFKKDVENEESINLDHKRTDIENRRIEELNKFLIDVRQIDANKKNGDKTGYTIMKSWSGKAARKEDMDKIKLINLKYNKELRELDLEDTETEENEEEDVDIIKNQIEERTKQIDELAENIFENEKEGQIQKGEDIGRLNKIEVDSTNKITEYDTPEDYEKAKQGQNKKYALGLITRFIKNNSHIKNMNKNSKEDSIEVKSEPEILKKEILNKTEKEGSIEEFAELLKNNKIDQIIIAGEDIKELKNKTNGNETENKKEKDIKPYPDLDSHLALYLLNNYNKKTPEETFNDGAVISVIGKDGRGKDLIEKKEGLIVYIDTGGNWLKIEKEGETTTIYIDHHGVGKREPTSGTKMISEIMEKAGISKEKPEWLNKLITFVNDVDNLNYVDAKFFTENYFRNEWPNSLYALAEKKIPFNTLLELCESEKIKDPSKPFTDEELNGEIGSIKIGKYTIKELCKQQKTAVEKTLDGGIKNSIKHNKEEGRNLEKTRLGRIIYQDYYEFIKGKSNTVLDYLSFKSTKAKNYDTYIDWNPQEAIFYINSKNPNLSTIVEDLNKKYPGCAVDVRGVMVFGKIIEGLTEEEFLNTIDPKILKDAKLIKKRGEKAKPDQEKNEPEKREDSEKNDIELKNEKQIQREKAIEELKNEIDRLTKERDEKIEAIRAKYKNS